MKTISAVIITINNKDVVNAIDSVRSSCSQIVVVDTGSTQEHLGFLKQIEGIELHYFKWCEDFSAARNYGLQFATGDYILTIDSDEVLEKQIHADMLTADIYGLLQKNNSTNKIWSSRLFKNHIGITYRNKLHETIDHFITPTNYLRCDAKLIHTGYALSMEDLTKKLDRNERIIKTDYDNEVRNFHLGNFALVRGKNNKAIRYYKKALKDRLNDEHLAMTYNNMYTAYIKRGFFFRDPVRFLIESLKLFPNQFYGRSLIIEYLINTISNRNKETQVNLIKKQIDILKNIYQNGLSQLQNDIEIGAEYFNNKIKELNKWQLN